MLTLPNILSIARIPLAFVFLQENASIRIIGILLAMLTDTMDGFLARYYRQTTQFGASLDPLMDKFFVFFALGIFLSEERITPWEMAAMLCRDFSVILFGFYLLLKGSWTHYKFRSIFCGKITTALQLAVLIGLSLHINFPPSFYLSFLVLGLLALVELYCGYRLASK